MSISYPGDIPEPLATQLRTLDRQADALIEQARQCSSMDAWAVLYEACCACRQEGTRLWLAWLIERDGAAALPGPRIDDAVAEQIAEEPPDEEIAAALDAAAAAFRSSPSVRTGVRWSFEAAAPDATEEQIEAGMEVALNQSIRLFSEASKRIRRKHA